MRSINTSVLNSLDLSVDEVAFLAPRAKDQHEKHSALYHYEPDPKRRFSEWLSLYGPKGLAPEQYIAIQLMHTLAHRTKAFTSVREIATQFVDGEFGSHHSSYACIALGSPSSNQVALVGTATLSSHYMEFDIQFGRIYVNHGDTPGLMGDIGLVRAAMSVEQFSMLIRGGDGVKAPTKLQVIPEGLNDMPPQLSHTTAHRMDFENSVRQAAQPFIQVIREISKIMASDLSKKANRVALGEAGAAAQNALDQVKAQISAMTVTAGEEETARVQRQFDAEIRERLSTIGIAKMADIIPRLN